MATKKRNPENTAVSVSLPKELLARMDARARSLGLNRSTYLCRIAETDLRTSGPLVISPVNSKKVDQAILEAAEISLSRAKAKARQ